MAWTPVDVTNLISSMEKFPILYNRDLPSDVVAHVDAMAKIELAINRPWSIIRKKWSELRHYHKSIHLAYMRNKKQEKPKWRYYDSMAYAIDSEYYDSSNSDSTMVSKIVHKIIKCHSIFSNSLSLKQNDEDDAVVETSDQASMFKGFDKAATSSASANVEILLKNRSQYQKRANAEASMPLVCNNSFLIRQLEILFVIFCG